MRTRLEELEARKLEAQGYIVIRAFSRGCPDIIAFRPEAAHLIVAREVKGKGDIERPEQKQVINFLKSKGVDAHFRHYPLKGNETFNATTLNPLATPLLVPDPTPKIKMTLKHRIESEKPWFEAGYHSRETGLTLPIFLNGAKKYSNQWYRMRAEFKRGLNQSTIDT